MDFYLLQSSVWPDRARTHDLPRSRRARKPFHHWCSSLAWLFQYDSLEKTAYVVVIVNIFTMDFYLLVCYAILNLKAFCFGAIPDIVIELIVYGSVPQSR
jgi:hypothetical protein